MENLFYFSYNLSRTELHQYCVFAFFQVSVALAGRSVQQDHWKDNISRKQENSSRSANRTSSTVPQSMAIMAAREVSWIMLSGMKTRNSGFTLFA